MKSGVCARACWYWGWPDCEDAGWEQGSLHYIQVSFQGCYHTVLTFAPQGWEERLFHKKGRRRAHRGSYIIGTSEWDAILNSYHCQYARASNWKATMLQLQAALGGTIRVQGIYEDINLQIPPGTPSHTRWKSQNLTDILPFNIWIFHLYNSLKVMQHSLYLAALKPRRNPFFL